MALVIKDRVQQTGTANTTVSFSLSGAVTGFQSFTAIGNTNTTYYSATDASGNWEVGLGTYATTGTTLTRTTILSSSNSNAAVTFSGTVNVFVTYPSGKAIIQDQNGVANLTDPIITGTILEDIFDLTDAATVAIDPGNGSIQTLTLTGTARTLTFTNMVNGEAITLMVNDGSAGTITTWNATFVNNAGAAPTLSLTGYTVVSIWKVSGTVYAAVVGNA